MSSAAPERPEDDLEIQQPHHAPAAGDRPDWLVGPDEGAADELARADAPAADGAAPLRLHRPGEGDATGDGARIGLPLGSRPPAAARAAPEAWSAAASSVPTLRAGGGAPPARRAASPQSAASRAFDGPPPPPPRVERALPAGESLTGRAAPAAGDDDGEAADAFAAPTPIARAAPPPPDEPWWMVALDEARHNRRVHVVAGIVAAALAAWALWPRSEPGVSLADIRREPARFDGATVRVSGRVGEVFPIGGSHAFLLHQGRDTLVVFTRLRVPRTRDRLTIVGSVSTGFLDGRPRQALFEQAP